MSKSKRIEQAWSYGVAFGMGRAWAKKNTLTQDADKWITVKPHGDKEGSGRAVLIDDETGEIKAGMGNKFVGQNIRQDLKAKKTVNKPQETKAKIDLSNPEKIEEAKSAFFALFD